MPVPLSTIEKLESSSGEISNDVRHVITKRKRAKAVLWVAMKDNRVVSEVREDPDLAQSDASMRGEIPDRIIKLHPDLDQELIRKIQNS